MTHGELIKIAERWLMKSRGCGFVLTELVTFAGEIPDAIGFRDGMSILVECKTTRADFLSDCKKSFRQAPERGMGEFRFFMCPKGLIEPDELPDKWGLVEVDEKGKARQAVGPKGNILYSKNADAFRFSPRGIKNEIRMLCSALRRVHIRGDLPKIYEPEPAAS